MQSPKMRTPITKLIKASNSWLLPLTGFFLAASFSTILSLIFPYEVKITPDLWFNADIERVINSLAIPNEASRLNIHPLLGLIILPVARPIYFGATMTGLDIGPSMSIAAQLVTSISAGITWILVYLISLNLGLKRIQGFAVGIFFLSSSTFMFWWSIPETFPLGSPTILIPFFLLSTRTRSHRLWILSLVGSFSITITNLSAGLIAACARFGLRRQLHKILGATMIMAILLSLVQKSYIPTAKLPLQSLKEEVRFIKLDNPPIEKLYQFFLAPLAPLSPPNTPAGGALIYRILRFEIPAFNNIYPLGALAGVLWIFLLLNGCYAAALKRSPTSTALAIFAGIQLFLHFVYGDSPFLYSAHYTPVLILIAAYGLANRKSKNLKILLSALFCTLIAVNLIHNSIILKESFRIGELQLTSIRKEKISDRSAQDNHLDTSTGTSANNQISKSNLF